MDIKNISIVKLSRMYIRRFNKHDIMGLCAEMSFYLLTALFPFVILLFVIATLISTSMQEMLLTLISYLPRDLEVLIVNLLSDFNGGIPIVIVCSVLALWYMSNVMSVLAKAMNKFYGIRKNRGYFKQRLICMFFAVFIIILIFLSFALVIFGQGTQFLFEYFDLLDFIDTDTAWSYLRYIACLLAIFLTMTLIFKQLPNKKLALGDILSGAALTTVAWCIASYAFAVYVNSFSKYHIIYGSLASIIILVAWVYLSSLVILLGASLNAFWYRLRFAKKYNISTKTNQITKN